MQPATAPILEIQVEQPAAEAADEPEPAEPADPEE